jgi:hypothetical protein
MIFHSGKFWMVVWIAGSAIVIPWGIGTVLWWLDSVKNLNAMSVAAMILAVLAGFQSTLGMRKADPDDKF